MFPMLTNCQHTDLINISAISTLFTKNGDKLDAERFQSTGNSECISVLQYMYALYIL